MTRICLLAAEEAQKLKEDNAELCRRWEQSRLQLVERLESETSRFEVSCVSGFITSFHWHTYINGQAMKCQLKKIVSEMKTLEVKTNSGDEENGLVGQEEMDVAEFTAMVRSFG